MFFRISAERKEDWRYTFSASVLEIYNEQIYDLLAGGRDQDADKLDVKQVRLQQLGCKHGFVWECQHECTMPAHVCFLAATARQAGRVS